MADEWGTSGQGQQGGADEFYIDSDGFTPDDLKGGESVCHVGKYHFEIFDVKKDLSRTNEAGKAKSPSICFICQVQETVPGQSPAGSRLYHRIYPGNKDGEAKEGSRKAALTFGMGLGILASKEINGRPCIVDPTTGSTNINANVFDKAKGMQFMGQIKHVPATAKDPNTGREGFAEKWELDFGKVYQVDDPFVEDWPKNAEMLAAIGKSNVKSGHKLPTPPPAASNGNGSAKPPGPPTQTTTAASAEDDISDL